MRAFLTALSLFLLAAVGPPPAQANQHEETVACIVNAVLVGGLAEMMAACLVNANDSDPLCLAVHDDATIQHKTYPCATPCLLAPAPPWTVLVVASGSPGAEVTGALSCNGATAVDATATVSAFGTGVGYDNGSLPNAATMACEAPSVSGTVDAYVVFCMADP